MASNHSWKKIFADYDIADHDFDASVFHLNADEIKSSVQNFVKTNEREVRILCSQTKREEVPEVMRQLGLFILPVQNGCFVLARGEGYVDIPDIATTAVSHEPELTWPLETSKIGDSEMQHLDYAFAKGIIKTFTSDESLHLTIRGRKRTPRFEFYVGNHRVQVESVQTEVDAGYEGEEQVVLVEAKNSETDNTIIRQLYYPFRLWSARVPNKQVRNVFFEKRVDEYLLWEFKFADKDDYNSIQLIKSTKYKLAS